MFGWRSLRERLAGRDGKYHEKLASVIRRRDELKESVRQLTLELESRRAELETLRSGMEGLAYAHGRLLRNYNDQVQHNKALLRRLQPAAGGDDPPVAERQHVPVNARPLELAAFPPLSPSAASIEKFISTRYGFIFAIVPKVASQSILEALWQVHEDGKGAFVFQGSPRELFTQYPAFWSYFKIAAVRHPFRRAVSCYIDKVLDADPKKQSLFSRVGLETPPGSFAAFVDFLAGDKGRDELSDRHWTSQAALLADVQGNLWLDRFARHECLESDLQEIFGQLGLRLPPLRRVNDRQEHLNPASGGERQGLNDLYYHTPELEARLRARYRADYELLGYRELQPQVSGPDQNRAASSMNG